MAAGLLIECRGETEEEMKARIEEVQEVLRASGLPFGPTENGACATCPQPRALVQPFAHKACALPIVRLSVLKPLGTYEFKFEPKEFNVYWNARKV